MKTGIERQRINAYANAHQRLARKYGKATRCQNSDCESLNPKRYEWALIHGREYSDNINDYMQLCPSCHRKYDYNPNQGKAHSIRMKGRQSSESQLQSLAFGRAKSNKAIVQFSKSGDIIKEWHSLTSVFESLGILQSSISNNLSNKSKTAGGFIWKLKN